MTLIIFNCDSIILFPVLHLNLQFKKNSNAEAEKLGVYKYNIARKAVSICLSFIRI